MPTLNPSKLTPEQKKKIEQKLISIFKDIYFNSPLISTAKDESNHISEEIRRFILNYAESGEKISEVDLLLKAKEKGQELVESHELVFFDEDIDKILTMRAFLIPGMKVELTEENAQEKVTEDDLQIIDHELCISFKVVSNNEFTKLGNLLDIKTTLARALTGKIRDSKDVDNIIKENATFKNSLQNVFDSASRVLNNKE